MVRRALLGIALAVLCAVILALAVDWSRAVRRSIYPLMVLSQTIPLIALAPVVVIWFGFGPAPKIAIVTCADPRLSSIEQMLGLADRTRVIDLFDSLARGDIAFAFNRHLEASL